MKGTVKFYNIDKGYGFIKTPGQDYFVHIKDVKNPPHDKILLSGTSVEFDAQVNAKGKTAKNVLVLDGM